jgi:uncharacterized membrane protein
MDMTIEEACRFLMSGGVISPDKAGEMPNLPTPEIGDED